jgi:hypothetical protein
MLVFPLTGVDGTAAAGTMTPHIAHPITGNLETTALEPLAPENSRPISGVEGTGVVAGEVIIPLTGITAATAVGSVFYLVPEVQSPHLHHVHPIKRMADALPMRRIVTVESGPRIVEQ